MRYLMILSLLFSACSPQDRHNAFDTDGWVFGPDAGSGDAGSGDAGNEDSGLGDARPTDGATLDGHLVDAAGHDAAALDAGSMDAQVPDAGTQADAAGSQDGGTTQWPNPTAVTLTSTYFRAEPTAPDGVSAWAIESYPNALPENSRSTIFWGRFQNNACASPGYGLNVEHPLAVSGLQVARALYPDCSSNYGPSVDANVLVDSVPQHLLRSEVTPGGAFQSFGSSGQNSTGANAYIQAAYTSFNPPWQSTVANRLRPWGANNSTDPNVIRFALRIKASVTQDVLEDPAHQQTQQTLWMNVINEDCNIASSSSYCQIQFNFKTFNRGVGAYTSFNEGDAFNDNGQGGLIAVVGPINGTGQSTSVSGASAWTSWGSSTQLGPYDDKTFQVEMSWSQFQQLLINVTGGNPSSVYGSNWQNRSSWVLINVGYGLENYNPSTTATSIVEGRFQTLEVFAL